MIFDSPYCPPGILLPDHKHQVADTGPLDPKTWDLKTWLALVAFCAPIVYFIRERICKPFVRFVKDAASAPRLIRELSDDVQRLRVSVAINERQLWQQINDAQTVCWRTDENGKCVEVSDHMLYVLRRPKEQVLGDSWRTFIPSEDQERVFEEWDLCIAQKRDFECSYGWLTGDGHKLRVRAKAMRITVAGNVVGWVGTVKIGTFMERVEP